MAAQDPLTKSLKCPYFDGKPEKFLSWYLRFESYADVMGFERAIRSTIDPRMPDRHDSAPSTNAIIATAEEAAKKENKAAFAYLAICLESARDLTFVKKARTEEWPRGLAADIIKQMFARYKPEDTTSQAECMDKLMRLKLNPKANPAELFTAIANIQDQYESPTNAISESTLTSTVLRAVPDKYKPVITSLQLVKGNNLSIDDIEEAMELFYRNELNSALQASGKNAEGEVVLSSFSGGKCFKCGQAGHVKAECPNKKAGGNKNSKGGGKTTKRKCSTCGKTHAGPCWEDEANASKRPENWKSSKKTGTGTNIAAVAVDSGSVEYLLRGLHDTDLDNLKVPPQLQDMTELSEETDADKPNWFPFSFDSEDHSANEKPVVDHILEAKSESGIFDLFLEHELVLKSGSCPNNKISFPNIRALLTDPNVFIADSGATTHATPTNTGMTNLRKAGVKDSIKIASGTHEGAAQIGDLPCVVCNQFGQELQEVVLKDVTHSPSLKFNLFSTTKLQREGWKMIGDYSSITMQKGGMTVCFDIVIPTEKGAIYCVYLK